MGRTDTLPRRRRWLAVMLVIAAAYLATAYWIVPLIWHEVDRKHLALEGSPRLTHTADGRAGDPLNVALIGSAAQITALMAAAGWTQADPLGIRSDERMIADTVLHRPYATAPVSNLYLFGRREDLAFEQGVGHGTSQRHHVRLWRSPASPDDTDALWIGAATFDKGIGISHETGQVTHHIESSVDLERSHLFENLQATGQLLSVERVAGFHTTLAGRNGGGDPWQTDGALWVGTTLGSLTGAP